MCPALASGFFTTKPPGSPKQFLKEKYTSYTKSPVFIFLNLTFVSLFRVVSVYLCIHTHTHKHIHAHGHMHTHLQKNSFHLFIYIYTPLCIYLYTRTDSTYGHHQMVNTEIRLIIFFAAKDGEALYSQQKQDWELTVAQIMNFLLPNSD